MFFDQIKLFASNDIIVHKHDLVAQILAIIISYFSETHTVCTGGIFVSCKNSNECIKN